jgi:ferric-dicitrate binding protein FerR (iron transport regulator)
MRDVYEAILYYDEIDADERAALGRQLEAHPELCRLFDRWNGLRMEIRDSFDRRIPDRSILVLQALSEEGIGLEPAEKSRLDGARASLEEAFAAHPGLRDVVDQLRAACREFDQLWNEHWAPVPSDRAPLSRSATRGRWVRQKMAAAGTVLALSVVLAVIVWRREHVVVVRTEGGETEEVALADGSTVRLDERSRLSYRVLDGARTVRTVSLRGKAFFHIAPDQHAFEVLTPSARTRAMGTSFGVEADLTETRVILASGQVSVSSRRWGHPPVTLRPGEMSRIQGWRPPSPPATVPDMAGTLSWSGYLVFHDTPLDEVADHLSRTYGTAVIVAPSLAAERFTATLSPDSLTIDQAMALLAVAFDADVRIEEGSRLLTRERPAP